MIHHNELSNTFFKQYGFVRTNMYRNMLYVVKNKNTTERSGIEASVYIDPNIVYLVKIDVLMKQTNHAYLIIDNDKHKIISGVSQIYFKSPATNTVNIQIDITHMTPWEKLILKNIRIERSAEPAAERSAEPAAERSAEPAAERSAEPAAERSAEPEPAPERSTDSQTTYQNAVLIHVGNYSLWNRMKEYLDRLNGFKYDLWVTIIDSDIDKANEMAKNIASQYQQANILIIPNAGMDMGGFFFALREIFKKKIEYKNILKLHTKTIEHWRNDLTLPLVNRYQAALELLNRPNIGMVGCGRWVIGMSRFDKSNWYHLEKIFKQYGIKKCVKWAFVAGSIFWVKYDILKKIYSDKIDWFIKQLNDRTTYDYNWMKINRIKHNEVGNLLWDSVGNSHEKRYIRDGMMEHAIERFLGYSIYQNGLMIQGL